MLDKNELTLNNTERKLLWGIYETLQEIKDLLPVPAAYEQTALKKAPWGDLRRHELMALVKALPADKKPEGWSKLSNAELIDILTEKEGA
jgi:hypothetical protein